MIEHLAIIMDGNGRWATKRGLTRSDGHRAGAENIKRVVDAARQMGIQYMTVYAFSTENWKRPVAEVSFLMALIGEFTQKMLPDMMENNVRLRTIGRTHDLPLPARRALLKAIEATKDNTGFTLNIALSYGGRAEIVDAVNETVSINCNDYRNDETCVLSCSLIELFDEAGDVNTVLSKSWSDRRRGCCFACRYLKLYITCDFLSHTWPPPNLDFLLSTTPKGS